MSEITDNIVGLNVKPSGRCRVAYTLNDLQPVLCTLIGDQPLFYMDHEVSDEILDEEFSCEDFDIGLADIGLFNKDTGFAAAEKPGDLFCEFLGDCAFITGAGEKQPAGSIDALVSLLHQSRLADAYLEFAAGFKTGLHYSAQTKTAFYDRQSGDIFINPHLEAADQVLLAARELRRMWQHRNGALLHPLTFHPDQAVLINRAQSADLSVSMVRIAWELQLAGEKEAWERLEESSMGDLARAFARESFLDFRTLNNGVAASAVFETWFLSERCCHEDKRLIQQMLADYRGYVFDNPQSSQNITADLIFALGSMPFGKNYLGPFVRTIMGDPIFTEVRDRSNANFLWFIKFERSFRETEQELQSPKTINSSGTRRGASDKDQVKGIGVDGQTGEVITLSVQGKEGSTSAPRRKQAGGRVVDFRQGQGES